MSRYYNPEWCRWISPDDVGYLSFDYVEGLNLYCYCLNNPIMFIDELGDTPIIIFMITIMTIFVSVMILSVDSPNAITRGIVFEKPSILNFGNGEAVILSFMASFGRKDWYLDKKETVSFYISACDITAFAGYSKKSDKFGLFADVNIFTVGYDGKYIDFGIPIIGAGLICGWEDEEKKFRFKLDPIGFVGFDISIDIGQIIKDCFGLR